MMLGRLWSRRAASLGRQQDGVMSLSRPFSSRPERPRPVEPPGQSSSRNWEVQHIKDPTKKGDAVFAKSRRHSAVKEKQERGPTDALGFERNARLLSSDCEEIMMIVSNERCNFINASTAVNMLSKSPGEVKRDDPRWRKLCDTVNWETRKFNCHAAANVIHGYAKLARHGVVPKECIPLERAVPRAVFLANVMNPQEIANTIWGLATLRLSLNEGQTPKTLTRLEEAAIKASKEMNAQNVAQSLWGLSVLGSEAAVLNRFSTELERTAPHMFGQNISEAIYAFAFAEVKPKKKIEEIFIKRVQNGFLRSIFRPNEKLVFKPHELVSALWSFAVMGVTDKLMPKFIKEAANAALKKTKKFKPQEKADLLWALSVLSTDIPVAKRDELVLGSEGLSHRLPRLRATKRALRPEDVLPKNSFWIKHADADGWVDSKKSRKRDLKRDRENFFQKDRKGDFFPRHERVDLLAEDPYSQQLDFGPDDDDYDDDEEPLNRKERRASLSKPDEEASKAPSAPQRSRRGEGSLSEPDDYDDDDEEEEVTKGATFAPQRTAPEGSDGDDDEEEDELYGAFERPAQLPPRPRSSSTRVSHSKFL